jgi:hypothetical protein
MALAQSLRETLRISYEARPTTTQFITGYCNHLINIMAGSFAIGQSKTILARFCEAHRVALHSFRFASSNGITRSTLSFESRNLNFARAEAGALWA